MKQNEDIPNASKAINDRLREVNEQMNQFTLPIQKQNELIQKAIQPALESQKIIGESVNRILTQQKAMIDRIPRITIPKIDLPDLSSLTTEISRIVKSVEKTLAPTFEKLEESFRELPPQTQEALILLGKHGWYLDLEMPISMLWKLKDALAEGRVQETEEALVEHFDSRVDDIESSLVQILPARQKPISAAFRAHKRQEYELSVPVLLSQTDGICKELINEYLFIKDRKQRRNRPKTALYVDQVAADTYMRALLSPLAQTLPISQSTNERDEGFNELNRHMVLHGESLDYGTKTNSLKAISLINYVVHVLKTAESSLLEEGSEESAKINLLFDRFA